MMWFYVLWAVLQATAQAQSDVATVFSRIEYQGNSLNISVGTKTKVSAAWTDSISSLKLVKGYEFVGYSLEYAGEHSMIWDEDTPDMGKIWSNMIDSYIVRPQSFELQMHPQSNQKVAELQNLTHSSLYANLQPANIDIDYGNISTLFITPGYEITFYSGPNQTGNASAFSYDLRGYDTRVSSYSVRKIPSTLSPLTTPTPNTTQATTQPSSQNNTALIAGSSAGVVVVIALLVLAYMKRRKSSSSRGKSSTATATSDVGILNIYELLKYRLDSDRLQLDGVIGYGSFAEVWKGTYNGELVAVKKLQPSRCTNRDIQDFINEIALTARFNCPSIIKIIGALWTTPSDIKAVMEFMDLGDLRDYLARNSRRVFTWDRKCQLLLSVAEGLGYLHSFFIIHRDLKSRNVLLDSTKGVKLVDFGIAKEDVQATMTRGIGTYRWMAPEVLMDTSYTVAADIYSFGVLLSELDTHCIPYHDMKNATTGLPLADPVIIRGVMDGSIKPTFTSTCPKWAKSLGQSCLNFNPSYRPNIYQIISILREKFSQTHHGFV